MLVGITADLHLTSVKDHPERYNAFIEILNACYDKNIRTLIIAGDLFDNTLQNYSDFETICKERKYQEINIIIIPGNHDENLSQNDFTLNNVTIIEEPKFLPISNSKPDFLLIPYNSNKSMGEVIIDFSSELHANEWILIGHGDISNNLKNYNTYEPGIYMPISKIDIKAFQPRNTFLGHIHSPQDYDLYHYAGSPCGIDITETGYRRFLIYDLNNNLITSQRVNNDIIFFDETIYVYPVKDEIKYISTKIKEILDNWNIEKKDYKKVQLRLKIQGYTSNRKAISEYIQNCFCEFNFYNNTSPDISNLSTTKSSERTYIAQNVINELLNLAASGKNHLFDIDLIILEALRTIYEN